jgi:hypothetical protein
MLTVTVDEKESLEEYITFMRRIIPKFTGRPADEQTIREPEKALKSFKQLETTYRDRETCGNRYGGPISIEDPNLQKSVYSVVQSLFRYQIVHASKCAEILIQLFEIQRKGEQVSVRIHPNIMKKGMAEINRIGRQARQILVEYYEKCEDMYLKGVEMILPKPQAIVDSGMAVRKMEAERVKKAQEKLTLASGESGQRLVLQQAAQAGQPAGGAGAPRPPEARPVRRVQFEDNP